MVQITEEAQRKQYFRKISLAEGQPKK